MPKRLLALLLGLYVCIVWGQVFVDSSGRVIIINGAAATSTGTQYKWNPGAYGLSYSQPIGPGSSYSGGGYSTEVADVIAAAPSVKGYTVFVSWPGLESSTINNWTFQGCTPPAYTACGTTYVIDQILNPIRTAGQKAILVVQWGCYACGGNYSAPTTSSNQYVPNYILNSTGTYGAGVYGSGSCNVSSTGASGFFMQSGGGYSANIENSAVAARWNALGQQLASVYDNDPVLEGIIFIAMDANYPCNGSGLTGSAYYTAAQGIVSAWRGYFQHTSVGIQVAFDDGSNDMENFTATMVQNGGMVSASDTPGATAWNSNFWSYCGGGSLTITSGTTGNLGSAQNVICGPSNSTNPYLMKIAGTTSVNLTSTVGSTAVSWNPSIGLTGTQSYTTNWFPQGFGQGVQAWLGISPPGSGWTLPSPLLMTYSSMWPLVEPMDTCGPWVGNYFTPTDIINASNMYMQASHVSFTILPSCASNSTAVWGSTSTAGTTAYAIAHNPITYTTYPPVYPH